MYEGRLIKAALDDSEVQWMVRSETNRSGTEYVLYRAGREVGRYRNPVDSWEEFTKHAPWER